MQPESLPSGLCIGTNPQYVSIWPSQPGAQSAFPGPQADSVLPLSARGDEGSQGVLGII